MTKRTIKKHKTAIYVDKALSTKTAEKALNKMDKCNDYPYGIYDRPEILDCNVVESLKYTNKDVLDKKISRDNAVLMIHDTLVIPAVFIEKTFKKGQFKLTVTNVAQQDKAEWDVIVNEIIKAVEAANHANVEIKKG